ncbi:adenylate/guanylate cyclase domain-containing protein [Mesorhizobium sp.]|uniref:adenylate/guanylate cyclase domain-containing protein n=1 Tax=Mesorhizobium sp. TaxID=1871066 RepID=UPI000FE2A580|nr:adenylate/guanylate cyclase domain-containing protein [Mesorhizobium sp.]RWO00191.1 MAG: tetratricopeptide repeat protein [Mesorhizobium sp.]RWO52752.1 MAG: tetratricopeptide repeat protein [Mesorhizobium sp.]TIN23771.1 MAG: tetratricopeptide repeat protein [Mesorhizobium sp.]TIN36111.1 MAG: tetratricopeptide repeat protein [Mesorhizobium sp.]TJU82416.1 MAG: tetratricopeptide repeat protein [Mesorhizobium sp.]
MDRKLAAILAADVVGYSAQMERDEAGTFARLKAGRAELFEPEIARHHGRIFKLMGDGLLAEFASVVDAVECAVSLQRGLTERNASLPEAEQILVRIGINLGEVIIDGDDRYGDGVNIAARLQQLAEPGGICVSGKVAKEVEKKLAFGFEPLGEKKVKNVTEPVQVFRITLEKQGIRHRSIRSPPRWALEGMAVAVALLLAAAAAWQFWPAAPVSARPSVAVLPFENYGGDEATGRLADGLTEDIITDLARFPELEVVARNSTQVYKGKPVDVREVAKALHVGYVLEGSIQHQGGRVRITAQLIDAQSGNHLWSERWDRPTEDVFAVQTEISEQVTNRLGGGEGLIQKAGRAAAKRKPPENLSAYELYLLGTEKLARITKDDIQQAIVLLNRAVELDPGLARAWVELYHSHSLLANFGVNPETEAKAAADAAERAVRLDPSDAEAHAALGMSLGERGELSRAKAELQIALSLAPGSAEILTFYAGWAASFGEPERGAELVDRVIRLDPNYPMWATGLFSNAYFMVGRYDDALKMMEGLTPDNYNQWRWMVRSGSLAGAGRMEEAQASVKEALKHYPDMTVEGMVNAPGISPTERERYLETLVLTGFPLCASDEQLAKMTVPKRLPECLK